MPDKEQVENLIDSFLQSHIDELAWDVILISIYDLIHKN